MTGQRVSACEIGRAPQLLEGLALRGKRNNAAGRPHRDKRTTVRAPGWAWPGNVTYNGGYGP